MSLFLPGHGWLFVFGYDAVYAELDWLPLDDKAVVDLPDWAAPGMILPITFPAERYRSHPKVKEIREVWYILDVGLPFNGRELEPADTVDTCMGPIWMYFERSAVLADVARLHEPVRVLAALAEGTGDAAELARAVLDGGRDALPVLADALEETGHPSAPAVRELAAGEAASTKAKPKRKRTARARAARAEAPAPAPVVRSACEVVLIGGFPAGGKSTLARSFADRGYQRLNRDERGGKVDDLLPLARQALHQGRSVVMDNLYATRADRAGILALARDLGVPVRFLWLQTSLEDAQFNACLRMLQKHGRVLHPEDLGTSPYKNDPELYPVAVLYRYRKQVEPPTTAEGFAAVEKVPFERRLPPEWTNKAAILDFDGTLRTHEGKEKFPVRPSEVRALFERAPKLREWREQGFLLLGASNQSGVARGTLTAADAEACFQETIRQLGVPFDEVLFCPHKVPPISCYCRKPNPGMGVELMFRHRLDPRQCLYVGDQGTDRSFAERCGFRFADQAAVFER